MSADNVPAAVDGTPASGEPPSDTTGGGAKPAYVTEDALGKALEKMTSDVLAKVGRDVKSLREVLDALNAPKDKKPDKSTTTSTDSPTDKTLRERLTQLEEKETKQKAKAIRMSIRDALVKAGADLRLAELTVPAILESEGTNFEVSESAFGDYVVKYGSDNVATWAEAFMKGEDGKRIQGASSAPNLDLPSGGDRSKPMREVPFSQLSSVSDEELESGQVRIVPG